MIKAEHIEDRTVAEVRGTGHIIMMEFAALCRSMMDAGIPEKDLILAMALSEHMNDSNMLKGEDVKLAQNFMEELSKRVAEKREKRDAQANKSNSDT